MSVIVDGARMVETYRTIKNKHEAIRRLANLNCIPGEEVIKILLENGLKHQELPRALKKDREEIMKRPVEDEVEEKLNVPGMVHCIVPKPTASVGEPEPPKMPEYANFMPEPEEVVMPLRECDSKTKKYIQRPWELLHLLERVYEVSTCGYHGNEHMIAAAENLWEAMREELNKEAQSKA